MFEILTGVIIKAVEKIAGSAVDLASTRVQWRSSFAAKLLELFTCLLDVEQASKELYDDVLIIVQGKEPISGFGKVPMGRAIIKSRTLKLKKKLEEFSDALHAVRRYLVVYSESTYDMLQIKTNRKGEYIRALNLFIEYCPRLVETEDLTQWHLEVPSRLLGDADLHTLRHKLSGHESKDVRNEASVFFEREAAIKKVNLYQHATMRAILNGAEHDLNRLEEARRQLGRFIKENLPLDKIIV